MRKRITIIFLIITYIINSVTWLFSFAYSSDLQGRPLSDKELLVLETNWTIREVSGAAFFVCVILLHMFIFSRANGDVWSKKIKELIKVYVGLAICSLVFLIINYVTDMGLVMNYFEAIALMFECSVIFAVIIMIKEKCKVKR